jgi:ketosteroid isomerase-like protein
MANSYTRPHLPSACARRLGSIVVAALLIACALPIHAGQNKPRKHDGRHQIDQLEEAWRTAVIQSDTNALSNLLADDYMAITASGTLQTKEQALANMRSGRVHVTSLTVSDRKVRFYAKTAVVTSGAHVEGTNQEGPISGDFRYTRVYVKNQQGDWKIVSFEASKIRARGERR